MSVAHRRYTIQEFVALEQFSNVRHEFLDGQIYAMAGGTPEHGLYAANVIGILTAALRGRPCRVHTSDVRIRISKTGLDTYPDVSVVCGHAELDQEDRNALTNPILLVEVLSPSTAEYDLNEKLDHYKQLHSLRDVLFVAHDAERLEVVSRVSNVWSSRTAGKGEQLELLSVGVTVEVDDVFRDPLAGAVLA
jgi:Uma2 family endonuclease